MRRMNSLRRLVAALLVAMMMISLFPASALAAEDDYVVSVVDSESAAISGAQVSFKKGEELLSKKTTDGSGQAKFDSDTIAEANSWEVEKDGYVKKTASITELPATPMTVTLEAVVVPDVNVSGTVVDGEENPVEGADVNLTGDATGSVKTSAEGVFTFEGLKETGSYQIEVTKEGFKKVTQALNPTGENKVTLQPKETVTLTFSKDEVKIAMGSSTVNAVTNSGGRTVEYSSDKESVVTVDASGKLTPVSIGTATITAKCAEDDNYFASEGSYSVTVEKGNQNIHFENDATPSAVLKDIRKGLAYSNKLITNASDATVTYSITSGADLVKDFDPSAGSFTVKEVGVISVHAEATSSNFDPASADYTLTVTAPFDPSGRYELVGDKGTHPWFIGDVTIKGSGYTFRYKDTAMDDTLGNEWKAELLLATLESTDKTPDGILNGVELYMKRNSDDAVVLLTLDTIYKDSTGPEAELTIETKNVWNEFLYIISRGEHGSNDPAKLTISAKDDHSNVKKIQYYFVESGTNSMEPLTLEELKALDESKWKDYSATIPITAGELTTDGEEVNTQVDAFFTAYAKVTDIAGNVTYVNSSGVILDLTDPTVTKLDAEYWAYTYTNDFKVNVKVSDSKDKSGIWKIDYWFTADDQTFTGPGSSADNPINLFTATNADAGGVSSGDLVNDWSGQIPVTVSQYNSKKLVLHVRVTDRAGNTGEKELNLRVSTSNPGVQLVFEASPAPAVAGKEIYRSARTAKLTIRDWESSFDGTKATEAFTNAVSATNIAGAVTDAWHFVGDWTQEGEEGDVQGTYTRTIEFTKDANYTIGAFTYTNKANRKGNFGGTQFVIDGVNPDGKLTVYEMSAFDKFLYIISFGTLENKKFTFFVSDAKDDTSAITSIEYYQDNFDPKTAPKEADGSIKYKTAAELDAIAPKKWKPMTISQSGGVWSTSEENLPSDQFYVIYIKITDAASCYTYLNSNGVILDETVPGDVKFTPQQHATPGYGPPLFFGDVTLNVKATDGKSKSGIWTVEYWIDAEGLTDEEPGGSEARAINLYSAPGLQTEGVLAEDLVDEWSGTIQVSANKYKDYKPVVHVKVTDRAGNVKTSTYSLLVEPSKYSATITFEDKGQYQEYDGKTYFRDKSDENGVEKASRTATITLKARYFNSNALRNTIVKSLKATNVNGEDVGGFAVASDWKAVTGQKDTYYITVTFTGDANYSFLLDKEEEYWLTRYDGDRIPVTYDSAAIAPNAFTIDNNKPTGKLILDEENFWDKLLESLSLGLYRKPTVEILGSYHDDTSPLTAFYIYKSSDTSAVMKETDLNGLSDGDWTSVDISGQDMDKEFKTCELPNDGKTVVYAKLVDAAGNVSYLCTNILGVDATSPTVSAAPAESKEYYNGDVKINITAEDPVVSGAYSGLASIGWWTECDNAAGEGDETSPNAVAPSSDQKTTEQITISAASNNCNGVKFFANATDKAGNVSANATLTVNIDTTFPTVAATVPEGYSNANQSVTITITERNFDPAKVTIVLNRNGADKTITGDTLSWTTEGGTGNMDDTKHIATLTISEDGTYTLKSVTCTDLAGNTTTESFEGKTFTVDKTEPTITITYDNNNVVNGNYYNAKRVATVTVVDENFDKENSKIILTATDDGKTIAAPTWNWTGGSNTYTATIDFATDAHYTFAVQCQDLAGNKAEKTEPDFIVDTTKPAVEITGVKDGTANNTKEDIGFTITATDTNFDVFEPKVTAVIVKDGKIVKELYEEGVITEIHNGKVYTVSNLEKDGIYKVTLTVVDKAGNEYTSVDYVDADGNRVTIDKTSQDDLLDFSVNREGSTFDLDDNTFDLTGKYYVQYVYDDVVIIETNVDELTEYHVLLNGKELVEGTDYTVVVEGGDGDWTRVTYSIDKRLFEEEGEYSVVVNSVDKATNEAFSDIKSAGVTFVVDRTAPVVTVSGMEDGGRYQTDRQTVTIIPTDDGGALASLYVALVDKDGNVIKELINLSGKELYDAMEKNNGIFVIELEEGLYQNVKIICKDCAVDKDGNVNTYERTFTEISVSSSAFMIFWANRPLRYGVLIGSGVLLALLIFFLVKRRKKDEEKQAAN